MSVLEKESQPIRGTGAIIDIDESKVGKQKYHIMRVADCTAATLIPLVKKYIKPGTKGPYSIKLPKYT